MTKFIGQFMLGFFIWIISCMSEGFVLHSIYEWYINPLIASAPILSYKACVGIVVFMSILTFKGVPGREIEKESETTIIQVLTASLTNLMTPWMLFIWAFGFKVFLLN